MEQFGVKKSAIDDSKVKTITGTNKQIASRRKARRGGNRLLLNALHGGTAGSEAFGDMTGLKDTLGSKQG